MHDFGTVMEQERDIQTSTGGFLGADHGARTATIDRILHHQHIRIGANIALLAERYETRPLPARFPAGPSNRGGSFLSGLVTQHVNLLRRIDALIVQRPDGQRGELILTEIAHHHEEMAGMLTALIKEDDSVRDLITQPATAEAPPAPPTASEANWENEGGASISPPAPAAEPHPARKPGPPPENPPAPAR